MGDGFEGFTTRTIAETHYMADGSIKEIDYANMPVRERMARAMWQSMQESQDRHLRRDAWDGPAGLGLQATFLSAANAALDVLLEPTDDMITAGVDARETLFARMESEGVDTKNLVVSRHPAGTIFVAMIKAARSEGV